MSRDADRQKLNRAANLGVEIRQSVREAKRLRSEAEDAEHLRRDLEEQAREEEERTALLRDQMVDHVTPDLLPKVPPPPPPPPGPPDPPRPPHHRPYA